MVILGASSLGKRRVPPEVDDFEDSPIKMGVTV